MVYIFFKGNMSRKYYLYLLWETATSLMTGVAIHIFKIPQALITLDSFIGRVLVNVIDVSF